MLTVAELAVVIAGKVYRAGNRGVSDEEAATWAFRHWREFVFDALLGLYLDNQWRENERVATQRLN
jgi:hypothetical protein